MTLRRFPLWLCVIVLKCKVQADVVTVGGYRAEPAPNVCDGTPLSVDDLSTCIKCHSTDDCLMECHLFNDGTQNSSCVGFSVKATNESFEGCTLYEKLSSTHCKNGTGSKAIFYKITGIASLSHRNEDNFDDKELPPASADGLIDAFNKNICGQGTTVHLYDPKKQSGKILGGVEVEPGEFPYQVLLEFHFSNKSTICGGSLIDRQWILSAKHCVENFMRTVGAKSFNVSLGRLTFWDTTQNFTVIEIAKDNETAIIYTHPKYNMVNGSVLLYDYVLVKLPRKLKRFTKKISPICLPSSPIKDYSNKIVVTSGWGYSNNVKHVEQHKAARPWLNVSLMHTDAEGKLMGHPDKLQKLPRRIMPHADCLSDRGLSSLGGYDPKIMYCASKSGNRDQCSGDSGGPWAVVDRPFGDEAGPKWTLIGLTSWGLTCGESFGVAASINDEVLKWIEEKTTAKKS